MCVGGAGVSHSRMRAHNHAHTLNPWRGVAWRGVDVSIAFLEHCIGARICGCLPTFHCFLYRALTRSKAAPVVTFAKYKEVLQACWLAHRLMDAASNYRAQNRGGGGPRGGGPRGVGTYKR